MLQAPQRTALSGPALVRLLTRFAEVDAVESRQSLSDQLSQWLGWTDAIALSSALNGAPPTVAAGARGFGRADEDECARVRGSLASAIAGDSVLAPARRHAPARASAPAHGSAHGSTRMSAQMSAQLPAQRGGADPQADYAVFRQRYLALQQSMETAIGALRSRLRALLAARTPAFARLAVVDAVMERALSERERTVLAAVPGLLGGHFARLREAALQRQAEAEAAEAETAAAADAARQKLAAADTAAEAEGDASAAPQSPAQTQAGVDPTPAKALADAARDITTAEAKAVTAATDPTGLSATAGHRAPVTQDAWLDVFRKDMQSVLLAELDVRFQPVEGLLAALRAC
ncbi:DUF3348 domain-containing protein [Burkholderia sp. Ax-1724]|uniref:DUF3348 domain-containing protein n=1 Tax=Burkholderia sp. Ax-1724 TaxID=2608336 RepID=UPI0014247E91|nr:DUF3348 domain-containing protein [Burkholderia sp. Ax-1724]NIF53900.1 DUF3348 domain-containing protein [Burkholderia sp. Ax-1724]